MALQSYALTSVDRVKDYLDISGTGDDTLLEILINQATDFVENYCSRRFKQTAYSNEEYSPGRGATSINLEQFPVDEGSTFTFEIRNSLQNEDSWETIDSEDYFVNWDAGIVESAAGLEFLRGVNRYRVTYTAGYDFDVAASSYLSDAGAGDLELAVWELVKIAYRRRKGDGGVESERIGDYSVTYQKAAWENDDIRAILDKYSREDANIGDVSPQAR